mmetsp:Transcript_88667/g.169983  ORF Transcript_88667/g.169983 Transcript_88667/m.169983 type:complete len:115 (-) Transcript_88667:1446-1790(-)
MKYKSCVLLMGDGHSRSRQRVNFCQPFLTNHSDFLCSKTHLVSVNGKLTNHSDFLCSKTHLVNVNGKLHLRQEGKSKNDEMWKLLALGLKRSALPKPFKFDRQNKQRKVCRARR